MNIMWLAQIMLPLERLKYEMLEMAVIFLEVWHGPPYWTFWKRVNDLDIQVKQAPATRGPPRAKKKRQTKKLYFEMPFGLKGSRWALLGPLNACIHFFSNQSIESESHDMLSGIWTCCCCMQRHQ